VSKSTVPSKSSKASTPAPPAPGRNRTPLVIAAVLAVVAVVAIAVVLTAGGDDDPETSSTTIAAGGPAPSTPGTDDPDTSAPPATDVPDLPPALVGEVMPMTVEGESLPVLEDPDDDPAVGAVPPTLFGQGFDGTPITAGAGDTNPTMLVFLAHWCPHCNAEIPRLIQLADEGRLPDDLEIIGVSTGVSPDRPNFPPSEWTVDMGWPWPMIADGVDLEAGTFVGTDAYGVSAFPFVTIIGDDGTVASRWTGESSVDELDAKIDAALGR
jgi:cytochrome c biogenesis protein CcmG/thiol:disulfide interchange protein DsbE